MKKFVNLSQIPVSPVNIPDGLDILMVDTENGALNVIGKNKNLTILNGSTGEAVEYVSVTEYNRLKEIVDQLVSNAGGIETPSEIIVNNTLTGNISGGEKDIVISNIATPLSVGTTAVTGKNVSVDKVELDSSANAGVLSVSSLDKATVSNITASGAYSNNQSQLVIPSAQSVEISDSVFTTSGYCFITMGSTANTNVEAAPSSIILTNVDFSASTAKQNAINIFSFKDNAEITFNNCKFGDLPTANVIQIFNLLNSKFTLKFVDCAFKNWATEDTSGFNGAVLLHSMRGYNIDFSGSTVIFENCTYADTPLTEKYPGTPDTFCGTKAADQLIYVYNVEGIPEDNIEPGSIIAYSTKHYPTVIIK